MIEVFYSGFGTFDSVCKELANRADEIEGYRFLTNHDGYRHRVWVYDTQRFSGKCFLTEEDETELQHLGELTVNTLLPEKDNNAMFHLCSADGYYAPIVITRNQQDENFNNRQFGNKIKFMNAPPAEQQANAKEETSQDLAEKPLNETERTTLLKIIISMAIDTYGYDPNEKRNNATGDKTGSIANATQKAGVEVSSKAIKTHLDAAKKLLPQKN